MNGMCLVLCALCGWFIVCNCLSATAHLFQLPQKRNKQNQQRRRRLHERPNGRHHSDVNPYVGRHPTSIFRFVISNIDFFSFDVVIFVSCASGRPKLNLYWRGFESPPPKIEWSETVFIAFARSHPDHFSRQIRLPNKFGGGASVDAQTRVFVVCGRGKTTNNSECVRHSSGRPN